MQQNAVEVNEYKGYSLFKEADCEKNRHRNRGVVMTNIIEDHTKEGKMSARGTATLIGYFNCIPPRDRLLAEKACSEMLVGRGVVPVVH